MPLITTSCRIGSLLLYNFISIAAFAAVIDEPIKIGVGVDPESLIISTSAKLSEVDRLYFEQAAGAIRHAIIGEQLLSGLTHPHRVDVYRECLDGQTPRKIILTGMLIRAYQYSEKDDCDKSASEKERNEEKKHMAFHSREAGKMAVYALKHYGQRSP